MPDGKRYVAEEPLLARRAPQVSMDHYASYGLGLVVERRYGVHFVYHSGDVVGYHSGMVWFPEHGVGGVYPHANGDPGWWLQRAFRRKLLELLFDGRPEADAWVSAMAKSFYAELAEKRKLVTLPADAAMRQSCAPLCERRTRRDAVRRDGPAVVFDFGEWKSEVASRRNPDGSMSFRAVDAGIWGFMLEFVVDDGAKRTLKLRDGQHEYTFTEK